ncbi:hypothetical protein ERO13_A13G103601v2 [Gossypium hirsutum]|nr:hypothetical protein ERO13_A13G103601v2 [Gossypium hirsutum]
MMIFGLRISSYTSSLTKQSEINDRFKTGRKKPKKKNTKYFPIGCHSRCCSLFLSRYRSVGMRTGYGSRLKQHGGTEAEDAEGQTRAARASVLV